jgi:hypothetical protein
MNPNNSNFVLLNLDSTCNEEPEFQKAKTLSKMPMISRGDYRLFTYLGQQCRQVLNTSGALPYQLKGRAPCSWGLAL